MDPKLKTRTWGFQFSLVDGMAIGVFGVASAILGRLDNPLWWVVVIAAGHFFLFCNVFRIVRRRELIWAGLFIVNTGVWLWFDRLTWMRVLFCQLPVTIWLIVSDTRSSGYHGIFANRLNPRLNDYLERRIS